MQKIVADIAVIAGLLKNAELRQYTNDRIFNTARPENEEQEDNIPYIIVTYEGLTPSDENKDIPNGANDIEHVNVLCVANDRVKLAELANMALNSVNAYLESNDSCKDFEVNDFSYSASKIEYDWTVPCVFQYLQYKITTFNS